MGNTKWKRCIALLLTLSMIFSFSASDIGLAAGSGKAAETERYIYFDNGLSGYDKVYYAVLEEGGSEYSEYTEMELLKNSSDKNPSSMDHVNPNYVYVTQEKIADGTKIKFKGIASGTVYDTMSNYQLNSISREWGYDYKDFEWETKDELEVSSDWDCYFAPALAMQNKYYGTDADGNQVTFIQPAAAAEREEEEPNITVDLFALLDFKTAKRFICPLIFTDTDSKVSFMINGSNESPIAYADDNQTFNLQSATSGSTEDLTSKMTLSGTGDLITVQPKQAGTLTVYASTALDVSDGTTEELTDSNDPPVTIHKITIELTAGENYVISSTETTAIYAVEFDSVGLETLLTDVIPTFADNDTVVQDASGTEFTIPKDTKFSDTTLASIVLPTDGTIQVKTAAEAKLIVNEGKETVDVTDSDGTKMLLNPHTTPMRFNLGGEKVYYIKSNDNSVTSLKVGYKGSIVGESEDGNSLDVSKLSGINSGDSDSSQEPFTIWGDITIKSNNKTATDETKFTKYIEIPGTGSKNRRSICFSASGAGKVIVYALSASDTETRYVKLCKDTEEIGKDTEEIGKEALQTSGASSIEPKNFSFSEAGDYYITSAGSRISIYGVKLIYDTTDIKYHFQSFSDLVYPQDGTNRTFIGCKYPMEGITGNVTDVNRVGLQSQKDDAEGCVATGDGDDGIEESVKTFDRATATIYDYFSDWELAGNQLEEHKDSGPQKTFSEGSNTISYSYQGDLLNEAIWDLYEEKTGYPLYFGSNSWFTGNGRYDLIDRYNTEWENSDYADYRTAEEIKSNPNSKGEYRNSGYAYRIPAERTYLYRFTGLKIDSGEIGTYTGSRVLDASLGMSNSRGLAGLVETKETDGSVSLANTGEIVSPYFNKAFLEGNNEKNAVYGKVYEDVAFRFKQDANGYYVFDSANTIGANQSDYAVRLTQNPTTKDYYMDYTGQKVKKADAENSAEDGYADGQFYPFNSPKTADAFRTENLMFGMKLTIPLRTYTADNLRSGILKFSGDDDVWAYLRKGTDSTLALDIGGTHGARGGVIDMKNGYAVTESTFDADDPIYGESNGTKGNSQTAQTTNLETAAFILATYNGVEKQKKTVDIADINGGQAVDFFSNSVTGGGSYTSEIVSSSGSKKDYFKVTLNGQVQYNGKEILKSGEEKTVYFAVYPLTDILNSTEDTVSYDIDIFYMERGLNSSNLKLAFKTVDITEREVEKEWTDSLQGFDNHNEEISEGQEDVKVDLWREYVTKVGTSTSSTIDSTSVSEMIVRASAYSVEGKKEQTVSTSPGGTVVIDVDVGPDTKYAVLALNGIKLTKEILEQFNGTADTGNQSLNLKILADGTDITDKIDENGYFPVEPGEKVQIQMDANQSTRTAPTEEYNSSDHETWLIENTNGWLVEFYPLQKQELSRSSITSAEVKQIADNGGDPLSASENKRFIIIENMSDAETDDQKWEHRFSVAAIPKDDELTITSKVSDRDSSRKVWYLRDTWKGLLYPTTKLNSHTKTGSQLPGEYGYSSSSSGISLSKVVKDFSDTSDYYISIAAGGKNGDDVFVSDDTASNERKNKKLLPITFTSENKDLTTEIVKIRDNISLSDLNDWCTKEELLADVIVINDEQYPYRYYISPEKVNDSTKKYYTKYYTITDGGKPTEILPVTGNFNVVERQNTPGDSTNPSTLTELTLYQFASADNTSKIQIVNTPYTELKLDKNWILKKAGVAGSITAQEPEEITITIYRASKANPAAGPTDYELYQKIRFVPDMSGSTGSETYSGTYDIYVGDNLVSENVSAAAVDGTGTGGDSIKKIDWTYILKNVPLYNELTGAQYQYYAVEGKLTMTDIETFYKPDTGISLTVDGTSGEPSTAGDTITVYPFAKVEGEEQYALEIENRVPPENYSLQIKKIDAADETIMLEGAEFKLYVKREEDAEFPTDPMATGTTDSNGEINFELTGEAFNNLKSYRKVYKLEETKAPDGYELPSKTEISFIFTVNEDGTLTFDKEINIKDSMDNLKKAELTNKKNAAGENRWVLILTITNSKTAVELPAAGASGLSWLLRTGSLLILLGGVVLAIMLSNDRRRKMEL